MAPEFCQGPNVDWCVVPKAFLSGPPGLGSCILTLILCTDTIHIAQRPHKSLRFPSPDPCHWLTWPLFIHSTYANLESFLSLNPFFGSRAVTLAEDEFLHALLPLEFFRHSVVLWRRLRSWEFSLFTDCLERRARLSEVRKPKVHMM